MSGISFTLKEAIMVEEKKLQGRPLGLIKVKIDTVRTIAQNYYIDYNKKSGAPKVGRGGGSLDNGNEEPHDINDLHLIEVELWRKSLEESEDYFRGTANSLGTEDEYYEKYTLLSYYDYAHERLSRWYGDSIILNPNEPSILETGIGQPIGHTGKFSESPSIDRKFRGAIYYANRYVKDYTRTTPNNYTSLPLYPHTLTIPGEVTINTLTKASSILPRNRQTVMGLFIEGTGGTFKLRIGNWTSDAIELNTHPTALVLDPESTLGEPLYDPIKIYPPKRLRSRVWMIAISKEFAIDQNGGYDNAIEVDVTDIENYMDHGFIPTTVTESTLVNFQNTCNVKIIGHYLNLADEPWVNLPNVKEQTTVSGPGYCELVLGEWKLISFTVGHNLTGGVY